MGVARVRIEGGPIGQAMRTLVDGKQVPGVHRIVLDASVSDVSRLTTYQFVEADVEVEALHENVAEAVVKAGGKIVFSRADTVWDALRDCARQLELNASREVAPSGTIEESGGRPPGH